MVTPAAANAAMIADTIALPEPGSKYAGIHGPKHSMILSFLVSMNIRHFYSEAQQFRHSSVP